MPRATKKKLPTFTALEAEVLGATVLLFEHRAQFERAAADGIVDTPSMLTAAKVCANLDRRLNMLGLARKHGVLNGIKAKLAICQTQR